MKGKLIKTSRGFEVEYNEKIGVVSNGRSSFSQEITKALLLHPQDLEGRDCLILNSEVNFEIVTGYVVTKECLCKDLSYEETKKCEHFTGAPINECLYMEQDKVKYAKLIDVEQEDKKITRFEVIDENGRAYTKYDIDSFELSYQDNGRTLKVFIK